MLGISKKGKNPKFEDLKFFENLKICSIECLELRKESKQSECLELRKIFFFQSLENM